MNKTNFGLWGIALLILINLILWMVFPPINDGRENFNSQYLAEIFSSSALILFSCGIFLTLRPRMVEPFFGGLDKMYALHQSLQVLAIAFIGMHFLLVALTSSGFNWGPSIGKVALIGLLTEIILALSPRIRFFGRIFKLKYHQWKLVHRFTGLFFLIAILHTFRVHPVMNSTPVVYLYVRLISFTGAGIYLYKELFERFFKKDIPYIVERVNRLNASVVEVSLKPAAEQLRHRAGQFLFIRFPETKKLGESHPFTISSSPRERRIRLTIKSSGDFTQYLNKHLPEGAASRLEGGYGMFDYKLGGASQVWIAGGIGLTPFMSWMRDIDGNLEQSIDFIYSVRSLEEALFLEEIQNTQALNPSFRVHLFASNRDGRLGVKKVVELSGPVGDKDIFLCGPPPMMDSLTEQFVETGVPRQNIHFEEFNFR
jgi:predicted ferric reductase